MELVNRIKRSSFLKQNLIFFIGSVAVGFLNYLYHPIIGRLLPPADFGEVQVILSLFFQSIVTFNVLGLLVANIVINYHNAKQKNLIIFELFKLMLVIGLLLLILGYLMSSDLQTFFNFNSPVPFIILIITLLISIPYNFMHGFLLGNKKLGKISFLNLLGSLGKLIFAVLLVNLGYGSTGGLAGLTVAQTLILIIATFYVYRLGLKAPKEFTLLKFPNLTLIKPELKHSMYLLVGILIVALQFSIDIIVVKRFFSADIAGLYAGIASTAKIIYFLSTPFAQVMISSIKINDTQKINKKILLKTAFLMIGISGCVLMPFLTLPRFITGLLMGANYLEYSQFLPKLSLAIFIIAIINLLTMYALALKRHKIIYPLLLGSGVTMMLIVSDLDHLETIVNNLAYGSLVMLGLIIAWFTVNRLGYKFKNKPGE